jgi:Predicted sugar kinase
MRSIGISAKITSPEALDYAAGVARRLRDDGYAICFDEATASSMKFGGDFTVCAKPNLGVGSDLLITFGGDGTLLSVARHAPEKVPIIGVNMGTLGFLTEIRIEEFPHILNEVLSGPFSSEERVTFEIVVGDGEVDRTYRVLNDAVINKSALARIVEMRVEVNGLFVSNFRADGLIMATPTGSTAYNLSAGGPIIYPTMGAMVVTPICPHMLSNRPLVLADDAVISVSIFASQEEIYLTLDGQEGFPITEHHRITVRKSPYKVTLVQSPNKNYFDVLRTKLKWGEG